MRIEKLYVSTKGQGRGIGKVLMEAVAEVAEKTIGSAFWSSTLTVEIRLDGFYEHQGFSIIREVDIPYFGYILDDYVMQKPLI